MGNSIARIYGLDDVMAGKLVVLFFFFWQINQTFWLMWSKNYAITDKLKSVWELMSHKKIKTTKVCLCMIFNMKQKTNENRHQYTIRYRLEANHHEIHYKYLKNWYTLLYLWCRNPQKFYDGLDIGKFISQCALIQMSFPPIIRGRWRVRSWFQDPLGVWVCNCQ